MIRLEHVTLTFADSTNGAVKTVFENFSLELPQGKTLAILGPSGCGKTTLLRLLSGLISPNLGNVTRETASLSYLFQDPALLPWLSAADNVNLVLSDTKRTMPQALAWLDRVELGGEANSLPAALSGGMCQRVALARALAAEADVLLLDEPFRGMDEALHARMRELIQDHRAGKTTVLVTHDKEDLAMADKVLVLSPGEAPRLYTAGEYRQI